MKKSSLVANSEERKRVGLWIRVSTDMQVEGESPEHHERRGLYYAEAKGWNVVETYRLDAQSGKSVMGHPETQRMLQDLRTGKITGLIFSKLARLARNTKELLEFADIFRAADADLISLQEAIDTSTPAGRLFYTMIAAMAQWEREEIADRINASIEVRAKMGKPLGGSAPFGYKWEKSDLVPDETEAPVRRLMYELFLQHGRKRTVARKLNESGYRTRNGSLFSDTTIDRLLRDTTAKGIRRANYTRSLGDKKHWELKPKEAWIETPIEPIIDVDTWDKVNAVLTENHRSRAKRGRPPVQLFAGIAHCHCGTKMRVPSNNPKYICNTCKNKIGLQDLEEIFHHKLSGFVSSPEDIVEYLQSADEILKEKLRLLESVRFEEGKLNAESDRVYRSYIDDKIDSETFGKRTRPLEARLREIANTLPVLQGEIDFMKIQHASRDEIIHEFQSLYDRWFSLTQEEKRLIVEHSVERITVGTDEITFELGYIPSSSEVMASMQHQNTDSYSQPM